MHVRSLLLALAFSTVTACSGGSAPTPGPAANAPAATAGLTQPAERYVGTPLATVNKQPVGTVAADPLAARQAPSNGQAFSMDEKKALVGRANDDELLFQAAYEAGLYHDPKVHKILVNLLLRDRIYGQVRNEDFEDEALLAYFNEHQDRFVVPEKVQIKRILITGGDGRTAEQAEALANSLQAKAAADPTLFSALAEEHSSDPYARRGGDMGYVAPEGKPGVPPEVVEAAFATEVGKVSSVFPTAEGFNIVLVANKRERLERTFDQMKGSVLRHVKNERYQEMTDKLLAELREGATISLDERAISAWTPSSGARAALQMGAGAPAMGQAAPAPAPAAKPGPGEVRTKGGSIIPADPDERDRNDEARALMEGIEGEDE